jgi:hypothetical protein
VFQIVDFSSVNDLKVIYVHLKFQKFSGVIPRTPVIKGRGGERREGERRGGDGMNPPKTNPVYGPAISLYSSCLELYITRRRAGLAISNIIEIKLSVKPPNLEAVCVFIRGVPPRVRRHALDTIS